MYSRIAEVKLNDKTLIIEFAANLGAISQRMSNKADTISNNYTNAMYAEIIRKLFEDGLFNKDYSENESPSQINISQIKILPNNRLQIGVSQVDSPLTQFYNIAINNPETEANLEIKWSKNCTQNNISLQQTNANIANPTEAAFIPVVRVLIKQTPENYRTEKFLNFSANLTRISDKITNENEDALSKLKGFSIPTNFIDKLKLLDEQSAINKNKLNISIDSSRKKFIQKEILITNIKSNTLFSLYSVLNEVYFEINKLPSNNKGQEFLKKFPKFFKGSKQMSLEEFIETHSAQSLEDLAKFINTNLGLLLDETPFAIKFFYALMQIQDEECLEQIIIQKYFSNNEDFSFADTNKISFSPDTLHAEEELNAAVLSKDKLETELHNIYSITPNIEIFFAEWEKEELHLQAEELKKKLIEESLKDLSEEVSVVLTDEVSEEISEVETDVESDEENYDEVLSVHENLVMNSSLTDGMEQPPHLKLTVTSPESNSLNLHPLPDTTVNSNTTIKVNKGEKIREKVGTSFTGLYERKIEAIKKSIPEDHPLKKLVTDFATCDPDKFEEHLNTIAASRDDHTQSLCKTERNTIADKITELAFYTAQKRLLETSQEETDPSRKVLSFKIHGEIRIAKNNKQATTHDLALLSNKTNDYIIKTANNETSNEYSKFANNICKIPNLQKIGGLMVCLVGITVIGLSIAALVPSVGGSAPISIAGCTLGVSAVTAGIAIACGLTVATATLAIAPAFFHNRSTLGPAIKELETYKRANPTIGM